MKHITYFANGFFLSLYIIVTMLTYIFHADLRPIYFLPWGIMTYYFGYLFSKIK
jgi:hypothetical protein